MIDKIKSQLKEKFSFSKREANGFFILIMLMAIAIFTPILYRSLTYEPLSMNDKDEIKLDSLIKHIKKKYDEKNKLLINEDSLEAFDPNTIPWEKLVSFGINKGIANRLVRYRSKGGTFYTKEDIKKIYGITDTMYYTISPYIIINKVPRPRISTHKKENVTKKPPKSLILINHADSIALQAISGIGSKLSKRIIKYRDLLGGFYSKSQYEEVYGLRGISLKALNDATEVDSLISKININTCDYKTLLRHPYFDKEKVNMIMKERRNIKRFENLSDIKHIMKVDDTLFNKVIPYLTLQ